MSEPHETESVPTRLVLIGPGPATRGGIAQFNSHLAEALAKEKADVTLLPLSPVYPSWTKPGRQGAVSHDPLPPRVQLAASRLVAWRPWTWGRAVRELRHARPHVIVFQWWHPMFGPCYALVATAARRFGSHVVFVCHNADPHEPFLFSGPLTALALKRADVLLVLSDAVGAAISRLRAQGRIVRLPHPPYTSLLRAADTTAASQWRRRIGADGRPVILFFGTVRPYKGLRDLISAFQLVRAEIDAILVVAGTFFESIDGYRGQIAELDLEGDVKLFPEYVPDAEVSALLTVADLIVLPYRCGSQTGIVPMVAALGKPIVSTAAGGISEGVPASRTAAVGDVGALARAIVEALRDPTPPEQSRASWTDWAEVVLATVSEQRHCRPRKS